MIVGQNKGQGVRMGSRQFWDKDTDNLATVTVIKKEIFITVCAFAVYLYWVSSKVTLSNKTKQNKYIHAQIDAAHSPLQAQFKPI